MSCHSTHEYDGELNAENIEMMWHYLFTQLGNPEHDKKVIMTEPSNITAKQRETIAEIMFESIRKRSPLI